MLRSVNWFFLVLSKTSKHPSIWLHKSISSHVQRNQEWWHWQLSPAHSHCCAMPGSARQMTPRMSLHIVGPSHKFLLQAQLQVRDGKHHGAGSHLASPTPAANYSTLNHRLAQFRKKLSCGEGNDGWQSDECSDTSTHPSSSPMAEQVLRLGWDALEEATPWTTHPEEYYVRDVHDEQDLMQMRIAHKFLLLHAMQAAQHIDDIQADTNQTVALPDPARTRLLRRGRTCYPEPQRTFSPRDYRGCSPTLSRASFGPLLRASVLASVSTVEMTPPDRRGFFKALAKSIKARHECHAASPDLSTVTNPHGSI